MYHNKLVTLCSFIAAFNHSMLFFACVFFLLLLDFHLTILSQAYLKVSPIFVCEFRDVPTTFHKECVEMSANRISKWTELTFEVSTDTEFSANLLKSAIKIAITFNTSRRHRGEKNRRKMGVIELKYIVSCYRCIYFPQFAQVIQQRFICCAFFTRFFPCDSINSTPFSPHRKKT